MASHVMVCFVAQDSGVKQFQVLKMEINAKEQNERLNSNEMNKKCIFWQKQPSTAGCRQNAVKAHLHNLDTVHKN